MSVIDLEVWQFLVEWYDPQPQMKRRYALKYFVEPHQVEMIDLKSKKLFLRKSDCPPEIAATDFFLGSKVVILARELEIVDYGDEYTKQKLQHQTQKSIAILTPDSYHNWGKIVDHILQDLYLVKLKQIQLSNFLAEKVCTSLSIGTSKASALTKGLCLVVAVNGEDGIEKLSKLCSGLQNEYGTNARDSALIFASNGTQATELTSVLADCATTATLDSCTCCVIKPHAVKSRSVGKILDMIIEQGYEISAIETLYFDRIQAEEFLEVYKGVFPEFADVAIHLTTGLSVALELRAQDAVTTFRQTAGPWDIDMAKELRPDTLRGKFGVDRVRNAVHCTDLPTDGVPECEYCFRLLTPVL